jgi:hypothetical protein
MLILRYSCSFPPMQQPLRLRHCEGGAGTRPFLGRHRRECIIILVVVATITGQEHTAAVAALGGGGGGGGGAREV